MRGFKNLALKIQSVFDDEKNESTKLGRLVPEGLINEGTRSQVGIIDRSGKICIGICSLRWLSIKYEIRIKETYEE